MVARATVVRTQPLSYLPYLLDKAMMPMAVPGTIDATMELALSQFPQYTPRALHRDPWILHFESFLNEEEVDPHVAYP